MSSLCGIPTILIPEKDETAGADAVSGGDGVADHGPTDAGETSSTGGGQRCFLSAIPISSPTNRTPRLRHPEEAIFMECSRQPKACSCLMKVLRKFEGICAANGCQSKAMFPVAKVQKEVLDMAKNILLCCILAIACALAVASDPTPLQDFCVADLNSQG
ncbi:hypothetical protein NL676_012384 [Syzygium grande]|nr:hypothetical protein NL676_012384 [Syzygium grande]